MASTEAVTLMAAKLPPGYTDLAKTMTLKDQSLVNVIGVVVDVLAPAPCNGTDFQMKLRLKDMSPSGVELQVKFFKRNISDFPKVSGIGDVVLLREMKMTTLANIRWGLSANYTTFIVFPKESIISPDFRVSCQAYGSYMPHHMSFATNPPTIHEQQWVITLYDHFKTSCKSLESVSFGPSKSTRDESVALALAKTSFHIKEPQKQTYEAPGSILERQDAPGPLGRFNLVASPKFSLISDVVIDESVKGRFCDLAGEVVKLYHGVAAYAELYLTDYTSNDALFDRKRDDFVYSGGSEWPGVTGKMILHMELHHPHGAWAIANLRSGDYVYLRNVRIKYNKEGYMEGNMWQDNAVNISILQPKHPQYHDLIARKAANCRQQGAPSYCAPSEELAQKKKKKKRNSKKGNQAMNKQERANIAPAESNVAKDEMDVDSNPSGEGANLSRPNDMPTGYIVSRSVKCLNADFPLSSFEVIVHNPNRWYTAPNGVKFEMPFVNANHHARVCVVDFYPHVLRDFSRAVPDESNTGRTAWEWNFWIVLRGGDLNEKEKTCINVSVHGADAALLIGKDIHPQDLSRPTAQPLLQKLEERLFHLWGDLKEQKDKFLHGHPHIRPDEGFSALKYNISSSSLPIETCIAEYGVEMAAPEGTSSAPGIGRWVRMYKIFDTMIEG